MGENLSLSKLHFRTVTDTDRDFLLELYASTRASELSQTSWDERQINAFIEMQFRAQDIHYRNHYQGALFQIVELNAQAIGRYYLHETEQDVRIMEITLLPDKRGGGIGRSLLQREIQIAHTNGKTLSLHVECFNPAMRLFERLGFRTKMPGQVYHYMECEPENFFNLRGG
ncbi:MAG: GNAT family N-acetyltransferase [Exilibacterium sp.]